MDIKTLNQLKAEKREIEAKIRAIEEATVYTKSKKVKAFFFFFFGSWTIAVLPVNNHFSDNYKSQYRKIVIAERGSKKHDLIEPINKIIIELKEMVDQLNEKCDPE